MSGLDAREFLAEVIRPTLGVLSRVEPRINAAPALPLLLGTALHESMGLVHMRQVRGPARSLFQIEPPTFTDVWTWASHKPALFEALRSLALPSLSPLDQYAGNQHLACAIARLCYFRHSDPLPSADDATSMAAYHKRWFNTASGAADPLETVKSFRAAIAICKGN